MSTGSIIGIAVASVAVLGLAGVTIYLATKPPPPPPPPPPPVVLPPSGGGGGGGDAAAIVGALAGVVSSALGAFL